MRIKITLSAEKPGIIDFNYQHQIQGLIYAFLSSSVHIRLKQTDIKPKVCGEECCGILKLLRECYNPDTGI